MITSGGRTSQTQYKQEKYNKVDAECHDFFLHHLHVNIHLVLVEVEGARKCQTIISKNANALVFYCPLKCFSLMAESPARSKKANSPIPLPFVSGKEKSDHWEA